MTRIKKWIITSVLITIFLVITSDNVYAKSYVTDNSIIPSNIHDYFKNYFGDKVSYQYFSYSCNYGNYNRTCYYGIDSNNNYIDIKYQGSDYSYTQVIEHGVDNNFSVSGKNIFKVDVSSIYVISVMLVFAFVFLLFWLMLGVII